MALLSVFLLDEMKVALLAVSLVALTAALMVVTKV
jgi:hypothetical protein